MITLLYALVARWRTRPAPRHRLRTGRTWPPPHRLP